MELNNKTEVITLGGGCFWCIESIFNRLKGVQSAVSGYSGGDKPNPTYEEVCKGNTDYVEVVQVTFQPEVISLKEVLKVFFSIHDPTQLNRQGNDIGTQYRGVIFYHNTEQQLIAQEIIENLSKSNYYQSPVVTAVEPLKNFYSAEAYHQDYFNQNKNTNSYCSIVVAPKVEKFEKAFREQLK